MADRLLLSEELRDLLGSSNVYFQPPASVSMKYPCIRYELSNIEQKHADDIGYHKMKRYSGTIISRDPDYDLIDKVLEHFRYCSFDRAYVADNLNHWVFSLYY